MINNGLVLIPILSSLGNVLGRVGAVLNMIPKMCRLPAQNLGNYSLEGQTSFPMALKVGISNYHWHFQTHTHKTLTHEQC